MKTETEAIAIPGRHFSDHDDGWDSDETLTIGTPSTPNLLELAAQILASEKVSLEEELTDSEATTWFPKDTCACHLLTTP
ncbi:unnamed protein product [Notodromas monacha]|uniref:Uncharacterized protein n=1 Tax=Notodromas monacha TaxID=399045 RepID=A0A7R9BEU5_9CRUS|nr:unnamed protein product [Notodromas monacha]CAG0914082.1 unnamed protein product [Notodromas monacha]